MSKIISVVLGLIFLSNVCFAQCDYAVDIKKVEGGYLYTESCHIEVGKKVRGYSLLEKQVGELEKTIELKDLALTKERERTQLWTDTSMKMSEKLAAYEMTNITSNWIHFGLGVGVTVLSVWAAGQLSK